MKTYSVLYNTTCSFEAIVKAKNVTDATKKVIEVVGEPVVIENVYEVDC